MGFKSLLLSAVLALSFGTISFGTSSNAATCTIGSCNVLFANDNDPLSTGVAVAIAAITNGGGGTFEYTGSFLNDTQNNARLTATVLQFAPSALGNIQNLVFEITAPASITPQSFQITDAGGFSTSGNVDVSFGINLKAAPNSLIDFRLFGTAVPGFLDANPAAVLAITPPLVPLPAGVLLMGTALAGFGVLRRRRKAA